MTDIPDAVRARYTAAAHRIATGASAVDPGETDRFGGALYDPGDVLGLEAAAGASLGCGNPAAVADLHPGETVLDLGSGAGLDVLISARRVGPTGRAIGLDATEQMLSLARHHAQQSGITNAEFLHGRIEDIPLPDASIDVVVSNCVITLSADKPAVIAEIARVLVPGGRIGISDVIADPAPTTPEPTAADGQPECLASSVTAARYESILRTAGLTCIEIRATHPTGPGLRAAIIRAVKPRATVVPMTSAHAEQVLAIYQSGIDEGNATFETTAPPGTPSTPPSSQPTDTSPSTATNRSWAGSRPAPSPTDAPTQASSSTPSTSTPTTAAGAWPAPSWTH